MHFHKRVQKKSPDNEV